MSINTDSFPTGEGISGLPDAAELEKLANELFSLLPNEMPKANFSPDLADHPRLEKSLNLVHERLPSLFTRSDGFNAGNPQTSLPDPHFPVRSTPVSGSGVSPSGSRQAVNQLSLSQLQTANPDSVSAHTDYPGLQHQSPSVAGSGISPSAAHQGNAVNLSDPQSGFHDPHVGVPTTSASSGLGHVPHSVAGSGVSPSVIQHGPSYANAFPFSPDTAFEPDVHNLWSSINTFKNVPQLPANPGIEGAQYYFLQGAGFKGNDPFSIHQIQSSQLAGKSFSHIQNGSGTAPFDVNLVKRDFPILQEKVNGKPMIWLDNAATTQKPKSVIDRITYFYEHENSNIHRAAHELAARATDAYESAREKIRVFLNAGSVNEIIFVRGATEAINLVAKTWGDQNLNAGDEIIVSNLEHHANIVPWQQLAAKKGLKLRVIPVDDNGQILLDEYARLLNQKTKLVSFTQVSNALGTVTPAKQMVAMAHAAGAKVLVDGAQSVSHLRSDVQALDCDWFVFSGHKVFGPTGIGVLYGKEDLLNETQPWQGGGNMIVDVTFEHTKFHDAPNRFEAGTGNIADAVGLGAAIDYVNKIGIDVIHQYEHHLLEYATGLMKDIPGLRLIGTAPDKASVLSFVFAGYKTEEVGAALNNEGIAVRSGHHCAQPILRRFGVETTVRPSLAFYNTTSDVDLLVETLYRLRHAKK
ncbi:family 2A encapsulin nanocompartment cargo protein cysteine desulfurase [Dyadobacter sp. NIV53]|uniref:family 2A encapsulin nanocompartment cargo protein cysteine desulfurase n=1 Tax=Dyadobacter sp. NIV53 TaxID=2861765 RepID=UPI001E3EA56C|nr:family 2A encapsulin nanocompartment cargo protein cysteine desulfurase [Dyadobacter sp. NIV53]